MDFFSFIECAKQTRSLKASFDPPVICSSEKGFNQVADGALTYAEPPRLPEYLPASVTVNFPSDWCQRYSEFRYNAIDAVVRRTTMLSAPFPWDQLRLPVSLGARRRERGRRHQPAGRCAEGNKRA
ncbi:autoinducer binding domain-containing protein [Bradyrhizobium sp. SSUT77]|nr:autoinducer binding domain-containing protein [Bradyrhizobium sp. SSUT77]MDH2348725.1 autoinducer binding domain-containing protein [Bradyrhizobium sp. SSUT77]